MMKLAIIGCLCLCFSLGACMSRYMIEEAKARLRREVDEDGIEVVVVDPNCPDLECIKSVAKCPDGTYSLSETTYFFYQGIKCFGCPQCLCFDENFNFVEAEHPSPVVVEVEEERRKRHVDAEPSDVIIQPERKMDCPHSYCGYVRVRCPADCVRKTKQAILKYNEMSCNGCPVDYCVDGQGNTVEALGADDGTRPDVDSAEEGPVQRVDGCPEQYCARADRDVTCPSYCKPTDLATSVVYDRGVCSGCDSTICADEDGNACEIYRTPDQRDG